MKKLFLVLAIGAAFAACGGNTETTTTADSTAIEAPATDSTVAPATDSTVAPAADSTVATDSAAK